jgi:type IV pilus assembly protein PilV
MTFATSTPQRRQRGISLIESLIAIVITALGILGILGVQMRTLSDTSTTVRRAQAIRLIEDLGERMKVNPNALASINTYVSAFADEPTVPNPGCTAVSGCSQADLVTYDLAVWKRNVRDTLPLGKAAVFIPPAGQSSQLGVLIAWRENERDTSTTYKDQIDATKVRAADGSLSAGGGTDMATNACPFDHTCHLQYIPVAGRCPPDSNFPGDFFCAGS